MPNRLDSRVVKSKNLITSQGPGTSIEFALAIVESLYGPKQMKEVGDPLIIQKSREAGDMLSTIGNTPIIELKSLFEATGCKIMAKCEHMNPGASVKDRTALRMIEEAEQQGNLKPGDTIVEASGGNTAISTAMIAKAKGYNTIFTVPEGAADEKVDYIRLLGGEVHYCPIVPFTDEKHYFH